MWFSMRGARIGFSVRGLRDYLAFEPQIEHPILIPTLRIQILIPRSAVILSHFMPQVCERIKALIFNKQITKIVS